MILRIVITVLGALGIGLTYSGWAGHIRDQGRAEIRAQWAAERIAQQQAAIAAADAAAQETARRLQAQQEADHAHTLALAAARRDAAAAAAAADGLRQHAAALAAAADRAAAACNPAPAPDRPPAHSPALVLADVLSRIDQVAGELAAHADATRIAGQQCAAAYDSLTPPGQ